MEYYYDGQWRSYEDLHDHYGITLTPTTDIILYDVELHEFPGWENEIETWIIANTRWYLRSDLPYYRKTDSSFEGYLIDSRLPIDQYELRGALVYNYNNHLYDYDFLHNNHGITLTTSSVFGVADGVIWSWYNEDEGLYWDDIRKRWTAIPPEYKSETALDLETAANFDAVGSFGLFYYVEQSSTKQYGSEVDGRYLYPISLNFPQSGNFNITKYSSDCLSGTWKLMSTASKRTPAEPCIVMALKVSANSLITNSTHSLGSNHSHTITNSGIDIIEEIDL